MKTAVVALDGALLPDGALPPTSPCSRRRPAPDVALLPDGATVVPD